MRANVRMAPRPSFSMPKRPQAFAGDALEAFRTLSMVRLRQRFLPQYARASMLGPVCAPMTGPMSAMWGSAWGN